MGIGRALRARSCLLALVLGTTCAPPAFAAAGSSHPHVIVIVVDTLRADQLGSYGGPSGISPVFDEIAAEGVVFESAIAASPWTQPSIASLLSSVYPNVHHVVDWVPRGMRRGPRIPIFNDSFFTLAEAFKRAGYVTGAFVANPLIQAEYGFDQGFDAFDSSNAGLAVPGSVLNKAAITWLRGLRERQSDEPFFLYLHYMDVHGPYNARREYRDALLDPVARLSGKQRLTPEDMEGLGYLLAEPPGGEHHESQRVFREYWVARYRAGIREFDTHLGALRSALAELDIWDDAYVVLVSDHGESLFEHGTWEHGYSTNHVELHVPLVMRWPGHLEAGRRVSETVRLIDVMPTLLEQLGLDPVEGIQGESLVPALAAKPRAEPRLAFAEAISKGPEQKALYAGEWKLIWHPESGVEELFHIERDPGETRDLAKAEADVLASMRAMLQQQLRRNEALGSHRKVERVDIDDEQRDLLRALGYVDDAPGDRPTP